MNAIVVKAPAKPAPWGIAFLLLFSVLINYVDRGNLSIAAPVLAPELSLTPEKLGLLFSSFFWTYSLFQIVSGWLVDRYNVNMVYAAGYLLWMLRTEQHLPCSCGGVIQHLTWGQHIVFNGFFIAVAATGIAGRRRQQLSSLKRQIYET